MSLTSIVILLHMCFIWISYLLTDITNSLLNMNARSISYQPGRRYFFFPCVNLQSTTQRMDVVSNRLKTSQLCPRREISDTLTDLEQYTALHINFFECSYSFNVNIRNRIGTSLTKILYTIKNRALSKLHQLFGLLITQVMNM